MAGEIFISYRRADEAWARLLHARLQAEGVDAWYDAHVGAGQDWRAATAKALEASHIFVLLFSSSAAQSDDIAKELAAATFEKKLIVPVRLENIAPKGAFLYELASRNWINAYDNTEAKLTELARSLAKLVKDGIKDESILPFDRAAGGKSAWQTRKWPALAAAACVIGIAAYAFWRNPAPQAKAPPAAATVAALSRPAGVSVAVLPFLNMSADKNQDFFSDGMTEEITSALAKVPGLTVIGRTSAFQFKGENRDMRAIGQALGAKNLIEGSVRKDGNEVRITAQLVSAADGADLWSQSYDRNLKGIFAVQEEIATAIANAMQVPLGLKQGENLVSDRTADTDSYQDYLRAKALTRARNEKDVVALMEKVVARDPTYAPAWAMLADAYTSLPLSEPITFAIEKNSPDARRLVQAKFDHMANAAHQALKLDPQNAIAYGVLGSVEAGHGNWAASMDYLHKALALDPNDPEILYSYGYGLAETGNLKEAVRIQKQILAQEPFVPVYRSRYGDLLWATGQNAAAMKIFESLAADGGDKFRLAKAYATAGRYAEAADAIQDNTPTAAVPREMLDAAARLMRSAPAKVSAPESLPLFPFGLRFVYLFVGAEGRTLDLQERELAQNLVSGFTRDYWAPLYAGLRKTEQFKSFVRKSGYVAYWRARGWPEFCHPVGADDFACN